MEYFQRIRSYARAQAIEDEKPVDVSAIARESGLKYPVVISRNLWDGYIDPAPQLRQENTTDRMRDTLANLVATIESTKNPGRCLWFTVSFQMHIDGKQTIQDVELKSTLSPGGDAVPMITIMLPDED
jgi:hypothetical protein